MTMRDIGKITILDLHLDTQEVSENSIRASIHLQTLLNNNILENIIVRSAHRRYHDVGSWCYLGKKSVQMPKKVEANLHRPERAIPIRNLVSEVITMACTDKTAAGAGSKLADFSLLVKFCDENGLENFLYSSESYHIALEKFTEHLKQSSRKLTTQAKLQSVVIECGSYLFPDCTLNFHSGIERIPSLVDRSASTKPPSSAPVKRYVRAFASLFEEVSEFILKQLPFPHEIKIDGESATLTTEAFAFLTENMQKTKPERGPRSPMIDYKTGVCRSWEEVREKYPHIVRKEYTTFSSKSVKRLRNGNNDLQPQVRRRLHKLAHDSFVALFAINSGENESTIIATPWNDSYEVKSGMHGKRIISIKNRGGTQLIEFTVPPSFVKKFERFLELRNHILAGNAHNKLFIGFDYRTFNGFRQLDENILTNLCVQMRSMVDSDFPRISYKKLRAYKDHWIIENYDQNISAAILQHSKKTQLKNYSNVEEHVAVDKVVVALKKIVTVFEGQRKTTIPSGFCSGAKPETSIDIPPGYEPDCKNSKGCIFCAEYGVTADAESLHKLYSMEYVIKNFLQTCEDQEHFNAIHQPALTRIEEILAQAFEVNPRLLSEGEVIRKSVYERHELTEYWERYLSRLVRIGALR